MIVITDTTVQINLLRSNCRFSRKGKLNIWPRRRDCTPLCFHNNCQIKFNSDVQEGYTLNKIVQTIILYTLAPYKFKSFLITTPCLKIITPVHAPVFLFCKYIIIQVLNYFYISLVNSDSKGAS